MANRKYGIEVYYATHGWMCGSADPNIRWAWSMEMPSYENRHVWAIARPIISQIAFPEFEENDRYNMYKMNPYIQSKLKEAGYIEDKDWHVDKSTNRYRDAHVLFRTRDVMKVFYDTLLGIKKYEEKV